MKTIWKFELPEDDIIPVQMPMGAKILSAKAIDGRIFVWAEVEDDAPSEERLFEVFGTGHPMVSEMGTEREFVQTVFMGWLVFHVYERLN